MSAATDSRLTPKPRRLASRPPRPLWIGLATLGLVVVVVGIRVGYPAYRQHVAIQEIERLGGKIGRMSRLPLWVQSFGVQLEYFDEVWGVDLTGANVDDADMQFLRDFPELTKLSLWGTRVSDRGLRDIDNLANLVELDAACTDISDEALLHLTRLTKLEKLKLHRTRVTDSGVSDLQRNLPKTKILR